MGVGEERVAFYVFHLHQSQASFVEDMGSTEIFKIPPVFDFLIIAGDPLHNRWKLPSLVGRLFDDEPVVDVGVDSLVLMHMSAKVKINFFRLTEPTV